MKMALSIGFSLLTAWAPAAFAAAPAPHQGYLGVDVRDVTPDEVPLLRLRDTHGAEIVLVDHDAPAGKCGLHEHDVVVMMDGQAIEDQNQLRRMLHDSPPGKSIVLVVNRDGLPRTITTQMAVSQEEVERRAAEQRLSLPEPQDQPNEAPAQVAASVPAPIHTGKTLLGFMTMNPSYTGLYLEKVSTQLAGFFGVPNATGLLVRSVQANSPAAFAGMHAGDVVVRANDKPIASTGEWTKAIKDSHGRPLAIIVVRDKREQTLTLTPDSKKHSSLELLAPGAAPKPTRRWA